MYKAIIADDEPKVALLIRNLIEWEDLGLQWAGTAGDGPSALALVGECRPDIVITDIRMPGYDGIEFIGRAKEISPQTHFLIVSGYRHFDYAQSAIRFGVEDYLLKPLKASEVNLTLRKMLGKCAERDNIRLREEDACARAAENTQGRRQAFIANTLEAAAHQTWPLKARGSESVEEVIEQLSISFESRLFLAFAVKSDVRSSSANDTATRILIQKTMNAISQRVKGHCTSFATSAVGSTAFCIVNLDEAHRRPLRRAMLNIVEDLQSQSEIFERIKVTVGVGSVVSDVNEIAATIVGAGRAVANRLVYGTGRVIEASPQDLETSTTSTVLTPSVRGRVLAKAENLDSEGLSAVLSDIATSTVSRPGISGYFVVKVFEECVELLRFAFEQHCVASDWLNEMKSSAISDCQMCSTAHDVFRALEKYALALTKETRLIKASQDNRPIRDAKDYIQSHYSEHISLERLSERAGLNATYFSALFKKQTGKNFLEYVAEVRVREAKRLLADGRLTIADIAESVGYSDVKHFSRIFTRATGLHPSEYRKLYY